MNINDVFSAKTEQELNGIIERNGGLLKLHAVMDFQPWNEYIVSVDTGERISRPGKAQPATVIYVATLPAQSLRITCTTNGISLFVNNIEDKAVQR